MSTTITYAGGIPITPEKALTSSYEARTESGVIEHTILDGPPVFTLRAAGPEQLTLALLFADETDALDCFTAHKLPTVFTITDTTRALLNFDYVVTEVAGIALDPQTRHRFVVTIPIREVV